MEQPTLDRLVASCDLVSPGTGHSRDACGRSTPLVATASNWRRRSNSPTAGSRNAPGGPRPMLAVTGTDGKTTTTLLTVEILRAAGLRTVDAGNTSTPLVDAIDQDLDAFVVECTSFRLAWTPTFRAEAAVWLNLAPDHLNWHASMATYEAAKAPDLRQPAADRHGDRLRHRSGRDAQSRRMRRAGHVIVRARRGRLPSVRSSTASAVLTGPSGDIVAASAHEAGACPTTSRTRWPRRRSCSSRASADVAAVQRAVGSFTGPPHRLELVADWNGVAWFNDSKATTPHAATAAIRVVRADHPDRRRLRQGRRPVADGGRPGPGRARDRDRGDRSAAGRGVPSRGRSTRGRGRRPTSARRSDAPRRSPARATPCCCHRAAPASTSTPNFEARGDHFRAARHRTRTPTAPARPHRTATARNPNTGGRT